MITYQACSYVFPYVIRIITICPLCQSIWIFKQALKSGTPLVTADSQVSYRFMIELNATNLLVPLAFGIIQYDPGGCYTTRLLGCDSYIP